MNFDLLQAFGLSRTDLVPLAFAWMLVLARVGAAMMFLPGIGEAAAPATMRAGIAFCLAALILPDVRPQVPPVPESGLLAGTAIIAEVTTGLWFGWLARVWVQTLALAAQFIAYLLGLSSVLQPDAELGPQSTALARLFELAAPLFVLSSGLYQLLISGLVGLYRVVPPGHFLPMGEGVDKVAEAVAATLALAVQLASPFIVAAIVWHVAIGTAARLIPRMQVYFVSMPGQILGGTLLLAWTVNAIIAAWQSSVRAGLSAAFGAG